MIFLIYIFKIFFNQMKDSLNSIVLYNFQKFHTHMTLYNTIIILFSPTPVLPLLPSLSPLVTTSFLLCVCESVSLLLYSLVCCIF